MEMTGILLNSQQAKLAIEARGLRVENTSSGLDVLQRTDDGEQPALSIVVCVFTNGDEGSTVDAKMCSLALVASVESVADIVEFVRIAKADGDGDGRRTEAGKSEGDSLREHRTEGGMGGVKNIVMNFGMEEAALYVPCYAPRHLEPGDTVDVLALRVGVNADVKITRADEITGRLKNLIKQGKVRGGVRSSEATSWEGVYWMSMCN